MKKFSKKGVLLFAGAIAACAFVLPGVASAATFGPAGTHHTLSSPNFGFTSNFLGAGVTSSCTSSSLTSDVANGNLEITSGSFGGLCTYTSAATGTCTLTWRPTRFPWTVTAPTTSNVQIHGIHIDLRFEQPRGLNTCTNVNGQDLTFTGTLTGGRWTGNAAHSLDFSDSEGLVSHSALGVNNPLTVRGFFTDTQETLAVN